MLRVVLLLLMAVALSASDIDDLRRISIKLQASQDDISAVMAMADRGVDFNQVLDDSGMTALHFAAMKNSDIGTELVQTLLLVGADPNLKATNGVTPMHIAAEWNVDSLVALLAAGGDPFVRNKANDDVVMWAMRRKKAREKELGDAGDLTEAHIDTALAVLLLRQKFVKKQKEAKGNH